MSKSNLQKWKGIVSHFFLFFSSVKEEKCSGGFTGETVTGEKFSLQPGSDDQHRATESSAGTKPIARQ